MTERLKKQLADLEKNKEDFVGKEGSVVWEGMAVNVRIIDYTEGYGKKRWLVTPLSGRGSKWIEQNPLKPEPIVIYGDK